MRSILNSGTSCMWLMCWSAIALCASTANAQQSTSLNAAERLVDARNIVPLIDQLKNGLRATQPNQVHFLEQVVAQVEQGNLPRSLVNLTYRWALQRHPRVPFPYFETAMRELAKRRGVML
ncbi:MAG: hypothetical protein KF752_03735 [Pirellulaceae bacterium]|nr:hypothetical protein [Pirellulaceae bacterium]